LKAGLCSKAGTIFFLFGNGLCFVSHWTLFHLSMDSVVFCHLTHFVCPYYPCCCISFAISSSFLLQLVCCLLLLFVATSLLLPLFCCSSFATSSFTHCNLFATPVLLIATHLLLPLLLFVASCVLLPLLFIAIHLLLPLLFVATCLPLPLLLVATHSDAGTCKDAGSHRDAGPVWTLDSSFICLIHNGSSMINSFLLAAGLCFSCCWTLFCFLLNSFHLPLPLLVIAATCHCLSLLSQLI